MEPMPLYFDSGLGMVPDDQADRHNGAGEGLARGQTGAWKGPREELKYGRIC